MPHAASPFGRPLKREGAGRIPVVVVTGFLGAGKTTLIRALLDRPEGAQTAVVVNEFGEIGIDQALLRASTDAVALLGNGCVCCRMRSDLQETLRGLLIERGRGSVPPFVRVVIETTGLADPGPILQSFVTDRALGDAFHLNALVCVADAATITGNLDRMPEAAKQVALADRIVVSKADLVGEAGTAAALALLRAANPAAAVALAGHGAVEPGFLLDPGMASRRNPALHAGMAGHLADIQSYAVVFERPLDWGAFAAAMDALGSLRGPDLLRVKGLVAIRGAEGPVVVHMVQHLAHRPTQLATWPDEDRRSRLVFIARGIPKATVTALLEAMQAAAG
jgi:G3E family GTPase